MGQKFDGVARLFVTPGVNTDSNATTHATGTPTPLRKLGLALALCGATGCIQGEPAGPLAPVVDVSDSANLLTQMEPSLSNIQQLVFEPACATSGCHDAEVQAGALDLSSAEASYDSLVGLDGLGVPAANAVAGENRWLRVKPGDADRSFLYRKMGLPGVGEGSPMPVGNMQITEPYMHLVRLWIEAGAEP